MSTAISTYLELPLARGQSRRGGGRRRGLRRGLRRPHTRLNIARRNGRAVRTIHSINSMRVVKGVDLTRVELLISN